MAHWTPRAKQLLNPPLNDTSNLQSLWYHWKGHQGLAAVSTSLGTHLPLSQSLIAHFSFPALRRGDTQVCKSQCQWEQLHGGKSTDSSLELPLTGAVLVTEVIHRALLRKKQNASSSVPYSAFCSYCATRCLTRLVNEIKRDICNWLLWTHAGWEMQCGTLATGRVHAGFTRCPPYNNTFCSSSPPQTN